MNLKKSVILFLAAGIAMAGCGPASTPQEPAGKPQAVQKAAPPAITAESETWRTQGLAAYQQFDYDAAIAAYDKALDADRSNYKALSGKGVAMAMRGNATGNTGDVSGGIALIQQALAIAPDYVPAFYDQALACKINGQSDIAIQYFQKVIAAEPDNTWSYYGIATIYGDKGEAGPAVAYLKKAVALDPDNVRQAASSQSHVDAIRSDKAFQALIQ